LLQRLLHSALLLLQLVVVQGAALQQHGRLEITPGTVVGIKRLHHAFLVPSSCAKAKPDMHTCTSHTEQKSCPNNLADTMSGSARL
jgi:hypothetical protein